MDRDLPNREYDRMSHDEILQEHGRRYQAMGPAERLKQSRQREAYLAQSPKRKLVKLNWINTRTVTVVAILAFGAYWFFTGNPPSVVAIVIGACWMLGTLAMEATKEICSRLDRLSDRDVTPLTGLQSAE
jgi:hypothetical protein